MRVFDGRLGISAVLLLSDRWILGCYTDGGRQIEGGGEDARSAGGLEGREEKRVHSLGR